MSRDASIKFSERITREFAQASDKNDWRSPLRCTNVFLRESGKFDFGVPKASENYSFKTWNTGVQIQRKIHLLFLPLLARSLLLGFLLGAEVPFAMHASLHCVRDNSR